MGTHEFSLLHGCGQQLVRRDLLIRTMLTRGAELSGSWRGSGDERRRAGDAALTLGGAAWGVISGARGGREQVVEADAVVEVPADQVGDAVDSLGSVVGGVDVDPERALALGGADDADDRGGDLAWVCVGRGQGGESAADLVYQVRVELVVGLGDIGVGGGARRGRSGWFLW
jgi:hypothetical protein